MQLHRLHLVNFRLHADTELVFGPGITAVVGPNGAGKTTLLEALVWAIYGTIAARGGRDSIRRNGSPARSPVRVEAEFSLGAHEYRVTRSLHGAELYQDGGASPVANSQQAVSRALTKILGMTRDEFFNTYFTGQKELTVMAAMGATERGKFLSRLMGYEKLRLVQDRLRSERSALRGEVTGVERGLEDLETLEREHDEVGAKQVSTAHRLEQVVKEHEGVAAALEDLEPQWKRMETLRESILSQEGELHMAEQRVSEARREFERIDRELAEALVAKDQLNEIEREVRQAEGLRAELEALERDAQAAGQRRLLGGQRQEIVAQLGRLGKRRDERGDAARTLRQAQGVQREAQGALDALRKEEERLRTGWVRDRQDAETKRLALRDQFRDLQKHRDRVVDAGPEGQCPTCTRPLGAEFETVLTALARQLEEIESSGKFFKQRVTQLTSEPDELRSVRETLRTESERESASRREVADAEMGVRHVIEIEAEQKQLRDRQTQIDRELEALPDRYDITRHEAVREELRRLDPIVKRATELRVRSERGERLVTEAERAERRLSEQEEAVRQREEAIAAAGFSEAAYREIKEAHHAAQSTLREVELREAGVRGDLKAVEAQLATVAKRLNDRRAAAKRLAHLRKELALHEELDAAFESLRAELNARLRPDLSDLASGFLSDLTDGRYHELELDEQYRLSVVEDGIVKPVISGGEEDVANLVLRLAISQMVAERAGQPLSLLILDEIFGGLDEHRRRNVVELLRGLGNRFPQVVLITHIESVKEGVDRVIRVSTDSEGRCALVHEDGSSENHEDAAA